MSNLTTGFGITGPSTPPAPSFPSAVVSLREGLKGVPIGTVPETYIGILGQAEGDGVLTEVAIPSNREIPLWSGSYLKLYATSEVSFDPGNLILAASFVQVTTEDLAVSAQLAPGLLNLRGYAAALPHFDIEDSANTFTIDMFDPDNPLGGFTRFSLNGVTFFAVNANTFYGFFDTRIKIGNTITDPLGLLHLDQGTIDLPPFVYTTGVGQQVIQVPGAKNYDGVNEFLTADDALTYHCAKFLPISGTLASVDILVAPGVTQVVVAGPPGSKAFDPVIVTTDGDLGSLGVWVTAEVTIDESVTLNFFSFTVQSLVDVNYKLTILSY